MRKLDDLRKFADDYDTANSKSSPPNLPTHTPNIAGPRPSDPPSSSSTSSANIPSSMSTKPSSALTHTPNLTLAAAEHAVAAAKRKADAIGVPMNIAVVDTSLYLLAFARMPGAKLTSIDIAVNKAFTAAGHRAPTANYKEAVWPGGAAFGIWNTNANRFTVIGGGVPVQDAQGNVVGAVGCSTGTPAQDAQVAQAAVDAVAEVLKGDGQVKAKL